MITSNHKKLVNACYPVAVRHKNLASISPDPNSLSKLIYYCATRPHKISKITSYLISYAQSQALPSSFTASLSVYRHSKPGLICTIKIFNSLLENHTINLKILGAHLSQIIAIGLGLFNQSFSSSPLSSTQPSSSSNSDPGFFGSDWVAHDLDITRATINLFSTYAQSIKSDCLQDDQLARNYLFFLAKFSSVAIICPSISSITSLDSPSARPKPARCMALMALESAIKAPALYSTTYFERQIQLIIPGLMSSITPSPQRPPAELLNLLHQACLDCSHQPTRSSPPKSQLLSDITTFRSIISPPSPPELSKSTELDLIRFSVKILDFLLNVQLTNLNQFEICVNEILNHIESTIYIPSADYYDWFGKSLLHWAMPKYRSSVIDLVVDRLTLIDSKQHKSNSAANHPLPVDHQPQYLNKMVTLVGILNSMINDPLTHSIQLLNTLNILHQLLRLVQSILDMKLTKDSQRLYDLLVQVIGSLAHTVYYDEQINDLCKDILGRIKTIIYPAPSEGFPDTSFSFEPSFVTALFDCLECILISSNISLSACDPNQPTSRFPLEHIPVSPSLWKDSLPILDDLQDPQCRHAFFKALLSFLKFEAFRISPASKAGGEQQLVQFLSAINVSVFRHLVEPARLFAETFQSSSLVDKTSLSEHSTGTLGPSIKLTPSKQKGNGILPATEAGWYECMLEIMAHQQYLALSVCLPMLRELDQVMMMSGATFPVNRETSPDQFNSQAVNGRPASPPIIIAKVWKVENLLVTIESIAPSSNRNDTPVKHRFPRLIDWDSAVKLICHSPLVQEKSGLDQATLEAHFIPHHWSLVEARNLSQSYSSLTSLGGPCYVNTVVVGSWRVRQRVSSAVGRSESPVVRSRATAQEMRKSYLSNLHNRSPQGSFSTIPQSPSVSDLRNSLLGTGFFHSKKGKGASISGRSSVLLKADLTHSADLNNHSTSDVSRYVATRTGNDQGPFGPLEEFGRLHHLSPDHRCRSGNVHTITTPDASIAGTKSSASHYPHSQQVRMGAQELLVKRRVTMARRQTMTSEILDKVRKNSLANSFHSHHDAALDRLPNDDDDDQSDKDYLEFIRKKSLVHPLLSIATNASPRHPTNGSSTPHSLSPLTLELPPLPSTPPPTNTTTSTTHSETSRPVHFVGKAAARKSIIIHPPYNQD
ncbi:hypothetical protein VP01_617g3 [Puccinia sorghi]|uniref:Protein EFR3 n=1 Tax=Puccinia sorghi TaxID=27349 RepID=A0A0L6UGU9_9BASI|nr:hypothetical protein VP01_617g3 [Puccinia sorghi]